MGQAILNRFVFLPRLQIAGPEMANQN